MKIVIFAFLVAVYTSLTFDVHAQVDVPGMIPGRPLPAELAECSGLIDLGDNIYLGLNDSGNGPDLFKFSDNETKGVLKVEIPGVKNVDWEELASDDYYIYIADTGNNDGSRKDQVVYRISRKEIFAKNILQVDKILISFPDQKKFKESNTHNYDCEAMTVLGDSLYFFSKNRGNGYTDCYVCPKQPGTYKLHKLDSFNAEGLITGAAYYHDGLEAQLALIGYSFEDKGYHPFILSFSGFKGHDFFKGACNRISFQGSLQTETICFIDRNSVIISNEAEHGDPGYLYKVYLKQP